MDAVMKEVREEAGDGVILRDEINIEWKVDWLMFADKLCLFRQNTYLQNKKHTLTCQGGTGCYRFNYQPGS